MINHNLFDTLHNLSSTMLIKLSEFMNTILNNKIHSDQYQKEHYLCIRINGFYIKL